MQKIWFIFYYLLSCSSFKSINCIRNIESVKSFLPEGVADAYQKFTSYMPDPETASKECRNVLRDCAMSRDIGCFELLKMCAMEKFMGTEEVVLGSLGDIDISVFLEFYAKRLQSTPSMVKRLLRSACSRHIPGWTYAAANFIPMGVETPSTPFICRLLTNTPDVDIKDPMLTPIGCNPNIITTCERHVPSAIVEDVFGTYLNLAKGKPVPAYYRPGWSTLETNGRARNPDRYYPLTRGSPQRLKDCWDNDDRPQCFAASLLAYVCENSCLVANCVWDHSITEGGACMRDGEIKFFERASTKCHLLATAMSISLPPPVCSSISHTFVYNFFSIFFFNFICIIIFV